MRLVTFSAAGSHPEPGVLCPDGAVLAVRAVLGTDGPPTVARLLGRWPAVQDRLRAALAVAEADPERAQAADRLLAPAEVRLHAPLGERVLLVCAGANYRSHALAAPDASPSPAWFVKSPNAVVGPGAEIVLPGRFPDRVDYEGELCIVFGRPCHDVRAEDAWQYVAGYTILNDVSARDAWPRLQGAQTAEEGRLAWLDMLLGKQFPTFAPMGPAVVTADEVGDPADLRLTTSVNGHVVQDASTRDLIVDIPTLVERMSRHFSFAPGDVLSTGTPTGVGVTRTPPVFLHPGDEVSVAVDGIGILTNPVTAPNRAAVRIAAHERGSAHA